MGSRGFSARQSRLGRAKISLMQRGVDAKQDIPRLHPRAFLNFAFQDQPTDLGADLDPGKGRDTARDFVFQNDPLGKNRQDVDLDAGLCIRLWVFSRA